jgi:mRNA interferase MazF
MNKNIRQTEIWTVNLNPVKGSEQAGFRPGVVISGNMANSLLRVVLVCPLSSKLKFYKGNPIIEPSKATGLKVPSEVLVFHMRSMAKERFIEKIGEADEAVVAAVQKTLNDIIRF